MKRLLLAIVISVVGCGSLTPTDLAIQNAYNSGQLQLGMPMSEVAQIVRPTYSGCVKQRITPQGNLVLWDFATNLCSANFASSYALIFQDGYLIEIRQVNHINDLNLDSVQLQEAPYSRVNNPNIPYAPSSGEITPTEVIPSENNQCKEGYTPKYRMDKWECVKNCDAGFRIIYSRETQNWACEKI